MQGSFRPGFYVWLTVCCWSTLQVHGRRVGGHPPERAQPETERNARGTRPEPFNSTPMAGNSVSSGPPHVRPMGVHRTCGEPDEIKKNTHSKNITAVFRGTYSPLELSHVPHTRSLVGVPAASTNSPNEQKLSAVHPARSARPGSGSARPGSRSAERPGSGRAS